MRFRRLAVLILVVALAAAGVIVAAPYVRSLLLVVRAANLGGRVEAFANREATPVTVHGTTTIPTRSGRVLARLYEPKGGFKRTILLIPGIHAAGIEEPRLIGLATDLAGSGVAVMTMALPDLREYMITPQSTDVIEDAIAWMSRQPQLAPDGRIGIIGVSFAGGMSIVAAGRPSVRDRVAFVVSFGGHGDLRRVMRYLCTGEEPSVDGIQVHPPHDYGVALILYRIADKVVPPDQVTALRDGVQVFLLGSQQAVLDASMAQGTFKRAREIATKLPEPSARYLGYVNDRNTKALGAVLAPQLDALESDTPSLSPERTHELPTAPVFLMHGAEDTVIPAVESAMLNRHLAGKANVRLLLTQVVTHAQANKAATAAETWKLVSFWADVLQH